MITIEITGNGISRLTDADTALGSMAKARTAYSRAINHSAKVAATKTNRALSDHTGLLKRTGKKALNLKVDRSTPASLSYTIHTRGDDISLKYFKPRETRPGVSAPPWNSRRVYPDAFMRAGWWLKRVSKSGWNGRCSHVLAQRSSRLPTLVCSFPSRWRHVAWPMERHEEMLTCSKPRIGR
jgi:hypothetical protein